MALRGFGKVYNYTNSMQKGVHSLLRLLHTRLRSGHSEAPLPLAAVLAGMTAPLDTDAVMDALGGVTRGSQPPERSGGCWSSCISQAGRFCVRTVGDFRSASHFQALKHPKHCLEHLIN